MNEEGLVRTGAETQAAGELGLGGKPLTSNGLIVGLLVLVAGLLLYPRVFSSGGEPTGGESPAQSGASVEVEERSIAVLPFDAMGEEKPGAFTEGIHDDLLTRLSNVGDLQVISRTSVEKCRDTELSLPVSADSLGVRWIVEGGVQQAEDQVRINAQFIDPRSDAHRWASTYERDLSAENVFAIQGEIAGEIAKALEATLTVGEQERIAGAPTEDLQAYRSYVKGRSQLDSRSEDGVPRAVDYFQQALQEDSTYALAWSGLADAQGLASYASDSLRESVPPQEAAARRALELALELAEAHASMGHFYLSQGKAPPALQYLNRAVELKPSYAQARHWLGLLQLYTGRPVEALQHLRQAVNLNPQHWAATRVLAWAYLENGQPEEAFALVRRFRRSNPHSAAILTQIVVLHHLQRFEEAQEIGRRHLSSADSSEQPGIRFTLAMVEVAEGDTTRAYKLLVRLQKEHFRLGARSVARGSRPHRRCAQGVSGRIELACDLCGG